MFLDSIIGFSLFSNSFSNSLEMIGNNDIGLYDLTSFKGLPGLQHNNLCHFPQTLGTYFSLNAALIKYVSMTMPFLGNCFSISPVIRSNPGAFLGFMLLSISLLISFGVTSSISFSSIFSFFSTLISE